MIATDNREVVHAFTDEEEAFFREGDAMSLEVSAPIEIFDQPSARGSVRFEVVAEGSGGVGDYYASFSVTIEGDVVSGHFEIAA